MSGASSVTIPRPSGCAAGEVLGATLGMGSTGSPMQLGFTVPADWTLVRRIDRMTDTVLAIYSHVATSSEPSDYTWAFDEQGEGVAWISCYGNVDTAAPIDADAGSD